MHGLKHTELMHCEQVDDELSLLINHECVLIVPFPIIFHISSGKIS